MPPFWSLALIFLSTPSPLTPTNLSTLLFWLLDSATPRIYNFQKKKKKPRIRFFPKIGIRRIIGKRKTSITPHYLLILYSLAPPPPLPLRPPNLYTFPQTLSTFPSRYLQFTFTSFKKRYLLNIPDMPLKFRSHFSVEHPLCRVLRSGAVPELYLEGGSHPRSLSSNNGVKSPGNPFPKGIFS